MLRRKKPSKSVEAAASQSRLDQLKKRLPAVKPGNPEPLYWAVGGAVVGLTVSVATASASETLGRNLQFLGLLLSSLLRVFPVAVAGALIGAFLALGYYGCRR